MHRWVNQYIDGSINQYIDEYSVVWYGSIRSEPPYDLLVLREATEAVQEVGGEGKEPKGG